jgi:hypothetical protein
MGTYPLILFQSSRQRHADKPTQQACSYGARRDAILHSKKGNANVYADLAASRHDQPHPQVMDEEWDGEPDDSSPKEGSHGTAPVQIDPLQNDAEDSQTTRAVLLGGARGPSRFGAETMDSVPFINTSDSLDK